MNLIAFLASHGLSRPATVPDWHPTPSRGSVAGPSCLEQTGFVVIVRPYLAAGKLRSGFLPHSWKQLTVGQRLLAQPTVTSADRAETQEIRASIHE